MLSNNTEFSKAIKKEEGDDVKSEVQSNSAQHSSPDPGFSIRRVDRTGIKYPVPKYIIRKAPTPTTISALKRTFIVRSASESKPDSKEIDKLPTPYDRPSSQNVRIAANSSNSEGKSPVRFWRTPTGKLVKLDAKVPTSTRPPLGSVDTLVKTPPKFIRLPNGKLARISTKKIPSPFTRGRPITGDMNGGQFSQFARDTGRLSFPSLTAGTTSSTDCSKPIDVTTLIGAGSTSSEETPLFETDDDSKAIKEEPMDVEETPDQQKPKEHTLLEQALMPKDASSTEQAQKSQTYLKAPPLRQPLLSLAAALKSIAAKPAKRPEPIAPPPVHQQRPSLEAALKNIASSSQVPPVHQQRPSLEAALKNIASSSQVPPVHQQRPSLEAALKNIASSSQVGDLGRIREQPLFSEDMAAPVQMKESCNVCRVVIPGLKKNMISLEGRLTDLVETVENLIMYLNPRDRKAAELASIEGTSPLSAESSPPDYSAVSTSSESKAYDFGDATRASNGRIPSILLPVARRNENRIEMRTVDADEVVNSVGHRPNVLRFVRQPMKSAAATDSSSSSHFNAGRIRFVVADRATTQRSVPSGSTSNARPNISESSNQVTRVRVGPGDDVKPEYGSASSDKSRACLWN